MELSHKNGSSDELAVTTLIGVRLVCESSIHNRLNDICLGVIVLTNPIGNITLSSVRDEICQQLHAFTSGFTFVTPQGWSINRSQECDLFLSHVIFSSCSSSLSSGPSSPVSSPPATFSNGSYICIQRSFAVPRVGILTDDGVALGFVFISPTCSLAKLRSAVSHQLSDLGCSGMYGFVDRNGWPVSTHQEKELVVVDLTKDACIRVRRSATGSRTSFSSIAQSGDGGTFINDTRRQAVCQNLAITTELKRVTVSKSRFTRSSRLASIMCQGGTDAYSSLLTGRMSSDSELYRPVLAGSPKLKPILISYVRAEAADHAVRLKNILTGLGFSVFLDVHEIKTGADWQDALNTAVCGCQVFVPLVTIRYGETQWTNREVKLADVLSKCILPVSFLDYWPPKCLAIQFATTQYIAWRPPSSVSTTTSSALCLDNISAERNSRDWSDEDVEWVGRELASRIRALSTDSQCGDSNENHARLQRKVSMLRSYPRALPAAVVASALLEEERQQLSVQSNIPPLIVVSLHPAESEFGRTVLNLLEGEGYRVWLSTEASSLSSADDVPPPASPPPPSSPNVFDLNCLSQPFDVEVAVNRSNENDDKSSTDQHLLDIMQQPDENANENGFLNDAVRLSQLPLFDSQSLTQPCQQDAVYDGSSRSQNSVVSLTQSDRQRRFQEKADEAQLIICVLSKHFAESRTTREQVFYCEHRKRIIPICYEDIRMPGWMSMLIGTKLLEDGRRADFKESLMARVRQALSQGPGGGDSSEEEISEERLSAAVKDLKERMADAMSVINSGQSHSDEHSCLSSSVDTDQHTLKEDSPKSQFISSRPFFVYISGSIKFYGATSQAICEAIGHELAELDGVHVVTGGFFGVGDTVGRSYHTQRLCTNKPSNIWHVLPVRDTQDHSHKGRQSDDRSFDAPPYGQTIYAGQSVRERETISSRAFDCCIIVEGGPGAAHEVEQFVWNDHIVIPLRCTGGAASGKFNVPEKIFDVPAGVSSDVWHRLADPSASPDEIGRAVANIVCAVRLRLSLDSPSVYTPVEYFPSDHREMISCVPAPPVFTSIKRPATSTAGACDNCNGVANSDSNDRKKLRLGNGEEEKEEDITYPHVD